jgi:hypothetical protein
MKKLCFFFGFLVIAIHVNFSQKNPKLTDTEILKV